MSRRFVCIFVGLLLPLSLVGCAPNLAAATNAIEPADYGAAQVAVVRYYRPDGNYDGWNLWAWPEDGDGSAYAFDRITDRGALAIVPLSDTGRMGFIIRKGDWQAKDVGVDRFADLDDDGVTDLWLVSGDDRLYTSPDAIDLSMRIDAAFLDASDRVTLSITQPLDAAQREGITLLRHGQPAPYGVAGVDLAESLGQSGLLYHVKLAGPVAGEDLAALQLVVPGMEAETVYARNVLNEDAYVALDAELGSRWGSGATTFRTWSPVAAEVAVVLYDSPTAESPARQVPMTDVGHGVWETTVDGDLHGTAYQIRFNTYGLDRLVPDIHCFSATSDSRRSVVVDLDRTDPDDWVGHAVPTVENVTDEVIYEVHVRDYSITDENCPAEYRGTYLGLVQPGDGAIKSGLAHLEHLGVSAVHLLPVHDYLSDRHAYNWGYWTALFNVPESNYATDPDDPTSAIRDLKTAVRDLHAADVRVILDVVYNHTATGRAQEAFQAAAPFYFFRTTDDGELRNDAGTGNSIADSRPMVRKYIVDSLKYWADEYQVDGFRFDLIGTHRPETVRAIAQELHAQRPDLTLYGEPWTGGGPTYFGKGAQRGMGVAVFNDHLRNALRGDLDGVAPGFATGPKGDWGNVVRGLQGAIDDFADSPTETVNYVSAHDNLTLWDKIGRTAPKVGEPTQRSMQKLALGIVLTSQGIAFLHAGSDFCRTKQGEHNSYNKGDAINALDWQRKAHFQGVHDYIAGLIKMRRAHPAFRMTSAEQVRENLAVLRDGAVTMFELNGAAVGDDWNRIVVIYNGDPTDQTVGLPAGSWTQVVNAEATGVEALGTAAGDVHLPPYTMAVFHGE